MNMVPLDSYYKKRGVESRYIISMTVIEHTNPSIQFNLISISFILFLFKKKYIQQLPFAK